MKPRAKTAPQRRASESGPIDPAKLGAAIDDLVTGDLRDMLDAALRSLTEAARRELLGQHLDLARLRPDPPGTLLADVRAFDAAVRGGEYYESFNVNSRNYMDRSPGTRRFIAECNRLLGRCGASSNGPRPTETRAAFELIFDLLRRIDEGNDDVFFADEQGSWQVDVEWNDVLPAWSACLAKSATPDEFGDAVARVVGDFEPHASRKHYAAARKVASAAQRAALAGRIRAAQRGTR